jgi:integrase
MVTQAKGIDPAVEKARAKLERGATADETFEQISKRFIERHCKPNLRSWQRIEVCFARYVTPHWGKLLLKDITRKQAGELIDGIVDLGYSRQAGLTLSYIHKLFVWSMGRGYVEANPISGLPKPKKSEARKRALTDEELRLVWNAASSLGWPFEPIAKLLMLTGQRRSEISAGSWHEVNLDKALWTLPASRVKNKLEHCFPLSPAALKIIAELPKIERADAKGLKVSELIFPTKNDNPVRSFAAAKSVLDDKAMELNGGSFIAPWTWHDLRRTCATGMAKLNIAPHIIEAALNHKSGVISGVAAVYNTHNYEAEKRIALEAWARKLGEIIAGEGSENVIQLKRKGS